MKSPFTGKEMSLVREKRTLTFRKEVFEFTHHAYKCETSNEQFTSTELDELNINQVYNQYREKHNIPFPVEIKKTKEKYGVSSARMSEILGLGANSYRLYEDGEIPQISNARLIQSVENPIVFQQMVNLCDKLDATSKEKINHQLSKIIEKQHEIDLNKIHEKRILGNMKAEVQTGYILPNFEKFSQMIVYFSEKLEPYKTKLNKLLFYSDFAHYKYYGRSISGIRYRAIDMGPVPNNFQSLFEQIQEQGAIEIQNKELSNDIFGEQFVKKSEFNKEMFSESEMEILQKVESRFKTSTTKEIIQLSHQEEAWIEAIQLKAIISYNYAFDLKSI